MLKMSVIKKTSIKSVLNQVKDCKEKGHFQQVVYSVHGNNITTICFGCKKIYTNLEVE